MTALVFDWIVGNLHNTTTNRFHPIVFYSAPMPSDQDNTMRRFKSKGHHTDGFDTREQALAHCEEIKQRLGEATVSDATAKSFAWDGSDVPAMVVFFRIDGDKAVPLIG